MACELFLKVIQWNGLKLSLVSCHPPLYYMEKGSLDNLANISFFCFTEERESYSFWEIWGWANNGRVSIFRWAIPLTEEKKIK